jgi:hypothetical protein
VRLGPFLLPPTRDAEGRPRLPEAICGSCLERERRCTCTVEPTRAVRSRYGPGKPGEMKEPAETHRAVAQSARRSPAGLNTSSVAPHDKSTRRADTLPGISTAWRIPRQRADPATAGRYSVPEITSDTTPNACANPADSLRARPASCFLPTRRNRPPPRLTPTIAQAVSPCDPPGFAQAGFPNHVPFAYGTPPGSSGGRPSLLDPGGFFSPEPIPRHHRGTRSPGSGESAPF